MATIENVEIKGLELEAHRAALEQQVYLLSKACLFSSSVISELARSEAWDSRNTKIGTEQKFV